MKWITREQVKVDRVACPWLITKFVDPEAEFIFVPVEQVSEVARTTGAALSPILATRLLATPSLLSVPFYLAEGLKLIYDFSLLRSFHALHPKEDVAPLVKDGGKSLERIGIHSQT